MKFAQLLDEKATNLAADLLRSESLLLPVLSEMRQKQVFAELNYAGVFDYCERKLRFSRAQAFYFKSVVEKADEVPEIRASVVRGELTLSQARRIVPILTKENHREWIEKARSLDQTELERQVTAVNPKAHIREKIRPIAKEISELKVPVSPETEENLTALRDILSQKLRKPATLAEVVAWAAKECRIKFDPLERAKRSRAVSSGNPKPGRHQVPTSVKHNVTMRDQGRCTFLSPDGRRCAERRWLDRHHIVEVSRGGLNTPDNFRTLCSAHHRLLHRK